MSNPASYFCCPVCRTCGRRAYIGAGRWRCTMCGTIFHIPVQPSKEST